MTDQAPFEIENTINRLDSLILQSQEIQYKTDSLISEAQKALDRCQAHQMDIFGWEWAIKTGSIFLTVFLVIILIAIIADRVDRADTDK